MLIGGPAGPWWHRVDRPPCIRRAGGFNGANNARERDMRQLIAGNWKMNGLSEAAATIAGPLRQGADGLARDLLVCPPFTQIAAVAKILAGSPVAVGGQDCHVNEKGAHTGDISAAMLRDCGASWVILGHSERRQDHQESDALVHAKTKAAIAAGLTPIVCVGETEAQRVAGDQNKVVGGQLAGSLPEGFAGVVAYEPVWAIGTGKTATEADVAAMHLFIRETLVKQLGQAGNGVLILYGGSVRPANAVGLLAVPHVGGALVGGASLNAEEFLGIARAAGG
jgi:triosephosphate isomerase